MPLDTSSAHPFLTASGETAIAWIFGGAVIFAAVVIGVALRRRSVRGVDRSPPT